MTERSRVSYSVINISASIGGYILNIILSFICRVIFVHILGAEYLGVSSIFANILSLLSLTELGIGTAMIYALYKPIADRDTKKIASYMRVYGKAYRTVGLVVFGLGLALMPFLKIVIREQLTISENLYVLYMLFLSSTAISYFYSYKGSILIANQKNYIVVTISYIVVILQDIAQIIVLLLFRNYILYLILQVLFVFITNVLISRQADHDYPYINDKEAEPLSEQEKRTLKRNIKALTITKLSGILVNDTDHLVIAYFKGVIQTGVVSNYSLLISIVQSFVSQIFTSLSASLGNLNASSDHEHKYEVFKALNLANFWVYAVCAIMFVLLSGDFITLFFGEEYALQMEIPIILGVNFYMLGMQSVVGMYKSTMGLFRHGQYALFFTAFFNLVGDIVLGKHYGVFGIFLATALARLITNTWYEPFVVYKFGLQKPFSKYIVRYLMYAVLLGLTGASCVWLCSLIHTYLLIQLLLKLMIGFVYSNLIFIFVFHGWEEFAYLKMIALRVYAGIVGRIGRIRNN